MPAQTYDADSDDVLTGEDAANFLLDHWNDVGLGMVDAEYQRPWFIVRRGGSDWTVFVSVADDTVVAIKDADTTSRSVPKNLRPDYDEADVADTEEALDTAFSLPSGGMYPLEGEWAFGVGYKTDDGDRVRLELPFDAAGYRINEDA